MNIEHDEQQGRFEAQLPAGTAYLAYRRRGAEVLDLRHTVVPSQEQGEGVGSALVEHAMRFARERGLRVLPTCPFVRGWLDSHPEFQDLVDRG